MNRLLRNVKSFITIVAIAIASLQILLGVVWMCGNFFVMENFGIGLNYVEASKTFIIDDYMGILYALIIAGARGISLIIPLPFYTWVYLLQLLISVFVIWSLIRLMFPRLSKKWVGFFTAYLLTIPMIMQFIMSVTPDILSLCLAMSLVSIGIRILVVQKSFQKKQWILAGIVFVLMGTLSPDYFFIGGLFLAGMVIFYTMKTLKNKNYVNLLVPVISFLAAVIMILGINQLTQQPGSYGRMEKTLASTAMSRLAGDALASHYFFWPEEIKQLIEANDIRYMAKKSDNILTAFGPMVEKAYGVDHAGELFFYMAKEALAGRTKEVITRIGTDLITYGFFPFTIGEQLTGKGISVSGWNYSNMILGTPILTRYYVYYGLNSFFVLMGLFAVSFVISIYQKEKVTSARKGQVILMTGMAVIITLWNGLTLGGEADYRLALFIITLWYFLGISFAIDAVNKDEGGTENEA